MYIEYKLLVPPHTLKLTLGEGLGELGLVSVVPLSYLVFSNRETIHDFKNHDNFLEQKSPLSFVKLPIAIGSSSAAQKIP